MTIDEKEARTKLITPVAACPTIWLLAAETAAAMGCRPAPRSMNGTRMYSPPMSITVFGEPARLVLALAASWMGTHDRLRRYHEAIAAMVVVLIAL